MLSNYKLHDFSFDDENAYVYILYRKFEIVYIGMTRKLDQRLFRHLKDKKFDTAKYIVTTPDAALVIERELIEFYKPLYNTTFKHPAGSNPEKKYKEKPHKDYVEKIIIPNVSKLTLSKAIDNFARMDKKPKLIDLLSVCETFDVNMVDLNKRIQAKKQELAQ